MSVRIHNTYAYDSKVIEQTANVQHIPVLSSNSGWQIFHKAHVQADSLKALAMKVLRGVSIGQTSDEALKKLIRRLDIQIMTTVPQMHQVPERKNPEPKPGVVSALTSNINFSAPKKGARSNDGDACSEQRFQTLHFCVQCSLQLLVIMR